MQTQSSPKTPEQSEREIESIGRIIAALEAEIARSTGNISMDAVWKSLRAELLDLCDRKASN